MDLLLVFFICIPRFTNLFCKIVRTPESARIPFREFKKPAEIVSLYTRKFDELDREVNRSGLLPKTPGYTKQYKHS